MMPLRVQFLGPAYFQNVIYLRQAVENARDKADLSACMALLSGLARLAANGLDSFVVRQTTTGIWRATMLDTQVLVDLHRLQWSASNAQYHAFLEPGDAGHKHWRDVLVCLSNYLLFLRRSLSTVVHHATLREWVCDHDCDLSARPTHPVTSTAYHMTDAQVVRLVAASLAQGRNPSDEWLAPLLTHYRNQSFPMRRSDIIALGRDLGLLYEAQAVQARSSSVSYNREGSALSLDETSDLVASAFSQWVAEQTLKVPIRSEPFLSSEYWQTILGPLGDRGVFYHGPPGLWRGYPGGGGMPLSPRLAIMITYGDLSLAAPALDHGSVPPCIAPQYDYCASLKDLVDAATDPSLRFPMALVSPVEGGWVTLLAMDNEQWHVRYLDRRTKVNGSDHTYWYPADLSKGSDTARRNDVAHVSDLGQLSLTLSSGELSDHLMVLSERIPA